MEVMLDLAEEQYSRVVDDKKEKEKKKPTKAWLAAFLIAYNAVTKYVYLNEVDRKRDRLAESINSSGDKSAEMDRGMTYWARMTGWYVDLVVDETTLKAYKDSGVKKVRWNTQGDSKVCHICRERNGQIYPIDKIPPKPHPGCRCWFTKVVEED